MTLSMTLSDLCFYCRIGSDGLLYDVERDLLAMAKFLVLICART